MPLTLKRLHRDGRDLDHWDAYCGQARVASIWTIAGSAVQSPDPWQWTMRCAVDGTMVRPHGAEASYEEAKAAVAREWRKWVEAAGLREKDDV